MPTIRAKPPGYEKQPYGSNRKEAPMMDEPQGRCFAQELLLEEDEEARMRIQNALDAGERKKWHLVGVSDVPPGRRVLLFWDTIRPSFGRTSE